MDAFFFFFWADLLRPGFEVPTRRASPVWMLVDFVLGFGAHDDTVGVLIEAIKEAQAIAKADNRPLEILGYVLGTDQDPQSLAQPCQLLTDAGVIWASSSTNTGLMAREFVCTGARA